MYGKLKVKRAKRTAMGLSASNEKNQTPVVGQRKLNSEQDVLSQLIVPAVDGELKISTEKPPFGWQSRGTPTLRFSTAVAVCDWRTKVSGVFA